MNESVQLGQIVRTKAGRDRGKWMVVVGFEKESFVYLTDGRSRRTEKPKLKKLKHVAKTNCISQEIAEALNNNGQVSDELVKRVLISYQEITEKKERDVN